MKPLSCIIIDDEPLAREVIETFVRDIPFLRLVNSFGDSLEALLYVQDNEIDIVFSDIQMPKINGIELVESLSNPPVIIFITAHRDFAIDGFENGVTDYLVKPVRFERFLKSVNKAKDYIELKQVSSKTQIKSDRLFIKSEGKLIKISLEEIQFIEAQGDYLKVVISDEVYMTQMTLKSMHAILKPPKFLKVQRSFIINLETVRSVKGNVVELNSGKKITISPDKKGELFSLLGYRTLSRKVCKLKSLRLEFFIT